MLNQPPVKVLTWTYEIEPIIGVGLMNSTFGLLKAKSIIFTPPRNRGGVIFSLQFVCVSVCVCVCLSVCLSVCLCVRHSCEQNSSRTNAPIWMRFSLNGCLQHWLETY